ncbi:hypothetical protein DFH11DRAFT_1627381 [Phellopilus nigrolimitatus]|nr:hypothetical protein DFH11DRAFT_1627381 [Phellopilus nigrolimitatus]
MRVFALYSTQGKIFAICLRCAFFLEAAAMLGIRIYLVIYEEIAVGILATGVAACGIEKKYPPGLYSLYWAMPLLFEIILLALAIYAAVDFWKTAGFKGYSLVNVVVQDQILYFSVVVAFTAFNIATEQIQGTDISIVYAYIFATPALPCIVGCWLLFHLKEAAEIGINGGTSFRVTTVADIEFI